MIGVCAFLVSLGKVLQKFKELSVNLAHVRSETQRIDVHGTTYSRYGIKGDIEETGDIAHRPSKVEENARKLDVISEKVVAIERHLMGPRP